METYVVSNMIWNQICIAHFGLFNTILWNDTNLFLGDISSIKSMELIKDLDDLIEGRFTRMAEYDIGNYTEINKRTMLYVRV